MTDQLEQLKTALADRYAIERELGAGGMATVYLAEDLKHRRQVAIKVLRPELAAGLGVDRFIREIEIAAQLTHPHILPLHDSGEADGFLYYVMPYVEGESLRDRISREGQLPLHDALQITREIAAALSYAHSHGVVHRDIKPENVLLSVGLAVVADFGIARAVTEAGEGRLTETGISIGSPAYMSPEQASGDERIDGRADIYALGCVLYEMLGGDVPYMASTPRAVLAKKLSEPTPKISVLRDTVPPAVEVALTTALAKTPADRYATAQQFAEALVAPVESVAHVSGTQSERTLRTEAVAAPRPSITTRLRQARFVVPAVVVAAVVAVAAIRFIQHRADVRWARQEALPEIERLIGENDVWRNLVAPYRLAERAEAVLGDDPELGRLFSRISRNIDVTTEPAGARVYMREYVDPDAEWSFLGTTPLEGVRAPVGIFRWKIEKEGYETVLAAASTWDLGGGEELVSGYDLVRTLDEEGSIPSGMVRVSATETPVGRLEDFFIGRHEVTNREYKTFVDAGGYRNRGYWKHPFVMNGRELTWEEAVDILVDQTGQPGPSTWLGGDYPAGQDEHPVSGVSWHEAAAYAEFVGMSLPTAVHWDVARGAFTPMILWPQLGGFGVLAPFANFGGQGGTVEVGSMDGITAYGAFDMPGNVREWCWNETAEGRVVRGGAWEDNTYEFGYERQAPSMDRSAKNGFRLASYPEPEAVPQVAFGFRSAFFSFDARAQPPVPDAVYQVYREQFNYDETALNAEVELREESPGGWVHEKVSFDAAYGDERVLVHLFLPANTEPPYQTAIYFPGSASALMPSSEGLEDYYEFTMFLSYLVRNGRAVVYPVYKGTFERGGPDFIGLSQVPQLWDTYGYTEWVIQMVKDLRRTIDYLETRPDVDGNRLAYYGMSWGGNMAPVVTSVEERFAASVLVAAGVIGRGRPEVEDLTYVTRVRTPTLILNGKYDGFFPPETSSEPMLDLLATPAEDKRLVLYETDHIPPRTEYIKETLAWLDKYLGPVRR